jgi:hypothetical protein
MKNALDKNSDEKFTPKYFKIKTLRHHLYKIMYVKITRQIATKNKTHQENCKAM